MMDLRSVEEALDLQYRSYLLLRWLADAIPRGVVSFDTVHRGTDFDSARAWLSLNYDYFPRAARPTDNSEPIMTRFANVFASYLEASFDLIESPGTRDVTHDGCYCPFCTHAVAAPHLQPKRLFSADKSRARDLQSDCLRRIATDVGLSLDSKRLAELLDDRQTLEDSAVLEYVEQLFRRCNGEPSGPWVLALWRTFAWTPTGAPKKDFRLEPSDVFQARDRIVAKISVSSPPS